jgi:hypothetical protein
MTCSLLKRIGPHRETAPQNENESEILCRLHKGAYIGRHELVCVMLVGRVEISLSIFLFSILLRRSEVACPIHLVKILGLYVLDNTVCNKLSKKTESFFSKIQSDHSRISGFFCHVSKRDGIA